MKKISIVGVTFVVLMIYGESRATDYVYVSVNGDTSAVSMIQGDTFGFGANLTGSSVIWEIWVDLDGDKTISPGDKRAAEDMPPQYDQDFTGSFGIPDMDSTPGFVFFGDLVGGPAATYTYLFRATDTDSTNASDTLLVILHPFPGAFLSGTVSISGVTPPDSQLLNIWVEASGDRGSGASFDFWASLTDSFGNFTIALDSFTLGDSADVRPSDEFPGFIVFPSERRIVISDTLTGLDFLYRPAAAMVSGSVRDDLGTNLPDGTRVEASDTFSNRKETSLTSGFYSFYFDSSEVGTWDIEVPPMGIPTTTYLIPPSQTVNVGTGDSLTVDFTVYRTDTTIPGRVTIEDTVPLDKDYLMFAQSETETLGLALSFADSATGDYNLYVSTLDTSWSVLLNIFFTPLPPGYIVEGGWWRYRVSPGDSVNFNMVPITNTLSGNFSFHPSVPDSLKFPLNIFSVILSYWSPGGFFDNLAGYLNPDTFGNYSFGVDDDTFLVFAPMPPNYYTVPNFYDSLVVTGDMDSVDFVIYSTLVGVEESNYQLPITNYQLFQNHPNPFHSNTTLRFVLPTSGFVSLTIYDLSGRLMKTLVEGEKKAGVYTLFWDGSDSKGRKVPSGIYFYRLNVGANGNSPGFTQNRKMILLR